MARKRKGTVGKGKGAMCYVCGRNCGKGGGLKKHVENAHEIGYDQYKKCFQGNHVKFICDEWDDSMKTAKGKTVIYHVLVRRFIGDPGPRGVSR